MSEPQATEQPAGDSGATGIYSMDDAVAYLSNEPYDGESTQEVVEESEEPTPVDATEDDQGDEESTDEEQESTEDQPEESEEDQPESTEESPSVPEDDLIVAQDGDTKITLGELKESYRDAIAAKDSMQADYQRKTQAVAEQFEKADAQTEQSLSHYQMLMTSLGQGLQQIDQSTDWQSLKMNDPAEYQSRLKQRNQLEGQLSQFSQGAESLLQSAKAQKGEREKIQAKSALDYLKNSVNGWNQDLYGKVAEFAEKQGMAPDAFYGLRDGVTIKAFHDLMRSSEARENALSKVKAKAPQEAQQKAQKRDARSTNQRKLDSLQKRVSKGDKSAAVELLMLKGYD